MTRQNRVNPWGVIEAAPSRGTWMGNRGILHDGDQNIVRPRNTRAWIICQLDFRGRRRELMASGSYTELFFLDEATALAAGHRPCFECRRDAAKEFRRSWRRRGGRTDATATDIDRELAEQRRMPGSGLLDGKRAYAAVVADLPEGVMIELDGSAWLIHDRTLIEWSHDGYRDTARREVAADMIGWVLTPYGTVRALSNGYEPVPHATLQ